MPFDFSTARFVDEEEGLAMRPLDPDRDAPVLHAWFRREAARFWNMQDHSLDQVRAVYAAMMQTPHARAYLGTDEEGVAFLLECYDPLHDAIAAHYPVRAGDLGLHLFVAPAERPIHGYTRRIFRTAMRFAFGPLGAHRIVVEPDVRNHRIHALNEAMGFIHERRIRLPAKEARLGFCTRAQFVAATSPLAAGAAREAGPSSTLPREESIE